MPYTTTDTVISESRLIMTIRGTELGMDTKNRKSVAISRLSVSRWIWLMLLTAWDTKSMKKHRGCGRKRLLNLIIKQRDSETGILPNLVHPQSAKRGLNVFGRKYTQATEPRVYVGNQLNHTITQMMGMLRIVENAQKYGRVSEMTHIKAAVEQHIIGFLNASYDPINNTLKSIVIDGTDLTDFRIQGPFRDAKLYFGAKEGGAFLPQSITPLFTSVCARGYRVSDGRSEFRDYLRTMFNAFGIGDIGTDR